MKHAIDPKIDCVFKALLGAEENSNLLIHFLNAMLGQELESPIVSVDILNPYNDKEMRDGKLSIVDIKARDEALNLYQIEIQLLNYDNIPSRIVYTWSDIYSKQLREGADYIALKPTYSIWLLGENISDSDKEYLHIYKFRDEKGMFLLNHGGIWLIELPKFETKEVKTERERWIKLFKEGEHLDDDSLPEWMTTPEMKQAMATLSRFSEKEQEYDLYQGRQNFLRQQKTMERELSRERDGRLQALKDVQRERRMKEAAMREKEAAMREREAALQREEAARAEIEKLKALLGQTKQ